MKKEGMEMTLPPPTARRDRRAALLADGEAVASNDGVVVGPARL
jgi:hypothetical protein